MRANPGRGIVVVAVVLLGAAWPVVGRAQRLERFFFDFQVDKPAREAAGNPAPHFPDSLRNAGVVGTEVVAFMVDTMGHPDASTIVVVKSTHKLFTLAVAEVVPRMTFVPAELSGHKVRERVTRTFAFSLPGKPAPPAPNYMNGGPVRWYSNFQVDKEAQPVPGNPEPAYPDSLRKAQFVGRVIAIFQVDSAGRVDPATFWTIDSWSPLFTQAVRDLLPNLTFAPAELFGHNVREQVQQRFEFALPGIPAPAATFSPEYVARQNPNPVTRSSAAAPPGRLSGPDFQTYLAYQVDKAATMAPGNPTPRYPDVLRQARIRGEVLAQFVVDTLGHAEAASMTVMRTTHDQFTQAVRAVLGDMKFVPAEVSGHHVRQIVQQLFVFEVP
jgi:TonB family protein